MSESLVQEFLTVLNSINDSDGNPWIASTRKLAIRELRSKLPKVEKEVKLGAPYFNFGGQGVFPEGYDRGVYYSTGIVIVESKIDNPTKYNKEQYNILISGETFRVTANAGFGNQSSTWSTSKCSTKGFTYHLQYFNFLEITPEAVEELRKISLTLEKKK